MSKKNDDTSDEDDGIDSTRQELIQCPACLRRMRREVFVKHPNTCRKNPMNQRNVRVFDITEYRSIKTGDKILPVRKLSPVKIDKPIARPSHTRSAKRDRRSDAFVPPVVDHFCCPMCKRTFCEKAYDRHVAFCTSKVRRIPQPPSEEVLLARLKLDRRVKFSSKPPISTSVINKEPNNPSFCLLPLRKKPYIPNCTHHCRNIKELFPIH